MVLFTAPVLIASTSSIVVGHSILSSTTISETVPLCFESPLLHQSADVVQQLFRYQLAMGSKNDSLLDIALE